jgi:hypothetical protein
VLRFQLTEPRMLEIRGLLEATRGQV